MRRCVRFGIGLSLALVLASSGCADRRNGSVRIVLITLDTLRQDAFERDGGCVPLERTRALAERGVGVGAHQGVFG